MPEDIKSVRSALDNHTPHIAPTEQARKPAAVAMTLRTATSGGLETLLIQRAFDPDDPWSGHMAFPGGRKDPGDSTLEAAARRETLEEVGLQLPEDALIGRLHDIGGGRLEHFGMAVAAFVYHHEFDGELRLNHEVANAVWVPLDFLAEPENITTYEFAPGPAPLTFPAYEYDDYVIWGITQRIIANFMALFGRDLPRDEMLTDVE